MYPLPAEGDHKPPWLQGDYPASQRSHGPPPPKKAKGNPVITRYPPPPGYKPPQAAFQQPPASYQQPGWPQASPAGYGVQAGYPYPQAGQYPGYPQQPYVAPQIYQQPAWPGCPPQPAPSYPQAQLYYPSANPGYQAATPHPQSAPPQPSFRPPSTDFAYNARRRISALHGDQALDDGNGDPLPPPNLTSEAGNELEHDFDAEPYFARHPDEIDPELSLGQVLWFAPQPTKQVLPATFAEAEVEAIAPRNPFPSGEESVSGYFVRSKREETLLSVRQTEQWHGMKDDLIFREFPQMGSQTFTKFEVIDRYRCRADPNWTAPQLSRSSPTRSLTSSVKTEPGAESYEMDMDVDSQPSHRGIKSEQREADDVLGNLEQAIYSTEPHDYQASNGTTHSRHHSRNNSCSHSRANSVTSQSGQRITRPIPLPPVRIRDQEDVLAALGVTGTPKLVYQTPGPAFGAPPPQQARGGAHRSRQSSVGSNYGAPRVPPPPPHQHQRARSPTYDPWKLDGDRRHGPGSIHSQHTAAGSDFHNEGDADADATPRPTIKRTESRKRGYEEEGADEEPTPKQQRRDVKRYGYENGKGKGGMGSAYARRW